MKKFKLISSITVIVLVLAVICLGIVMAIFPQNGITNSVTFLPEQNIEMNVVCEATWAIGGETGGKDPSITISIDAEGNIHPSNRWDAPDINFNNVIPDANEVVMTFSFTNTSSDPNNVLNISFRDIVSDSKNTLYASDPRFTAEVQVDDGERTVVAADQENGADVVLEVPSGQTATLNIYYILHRQNENINVNQNIQINIGVVDGAEQN